MHRRIDAPGQRNARVQRDRFGELRERFVVGAAHVREALLSPLHGARQGSAKEGADVIVQKHERTWRQIGTDAPGCIGQHHDAGPGRAPRPNRGEHGGRAAALVVVEAARLHQNGNAAQPSRQEGACVPGNGGLRQAGQIGEGNSDRIPHPLGQPSEPGAQDQMHSGTHPCPRAQKVAHSIRRRPDAGIVGCSSHLR